MKRYLMYLKYVLRHKYFVFVECWRVGLYWRAIVHDLDKLFPDEFIPYAKHFYDRSGNKKQVRDKTGYYKATDTGDRAFDYVFHWHTRRNRHHWQYWVQSEETPGEEKLFAMSRKDVVEMICDWKGAGRAQGKSDVAGWWEANKEKLKLHPDSRHIVEEWLNWKWKN